MTNLDDLLGQYDLLALASQYAPMRQKGSSNEWEAPCPAPGCSSRHDGFVVQESGHAKHGGGRWMCRKCHDRWGDALDFAEHVLGMSDWRDKLSLLGVTEMQGDGAARFTAREPQPPKPVEPPSALWQERAEAFCAACADNLWVPNHPARGYLKGRGLTDQTLADFGVGYCSGVAPGASGDGWWFEPGVEWGLPETEQRRNKQTGELEDQPTRVFFPRAIVIPWRANGQIWKVEMRLPINDPRYASLRKRYGKAITLKGSRAALYNADALSRERPGMLLEGELDVMTVHQEARDLITPVGVGGSTQCRDIYWISRLVVPPLLLLTFNADDAGNAAISYWRSAIGERSMAWLPPLKDPNDMLQAGLDIRGWVQAGIEQSRRQGL